MPQIPAEVQKINMISWSKTVNAIFKIYFICDITTFVCLLVVLV